MKLLLVTGIIVANIAVTAGVCPKLSPPLPQCLASLNKCYGDATCGEGEQCCPAACGAMCVQTYQCPPSLCGDMKCKYGQQKDANGCYTCTCRTSAVCKWPSCPPQQPVG